MENNKKYKTVFMSTAVFALLYCCAAVCHAQRLDIVSYVPVKSGIYDSLVTKNKTIFNSEESNTIFNLTVKSSILEIQAKEGIIFKDLLTPRLYVLNSYLDEGILLSAPTDANAAAGISFITLVTKNPISVLSGQAKQLNVSQASVGTEGSLSVNSITVGLDSNVKFKIQVPEGCASLGWKTVQAYPVANYINDERQLQTYKILGCQCSGPTGCENPS